MKRRAFTAFALFLFLLFPSGCSSAQNKTDAFTFTASGDFAANTDTDAALRLMKETHGAFHLALGDLSYDSIVPESAWCDYVKKRVGENFPFMLIAGNHESDGRDGLIDNFAKGLPDKLGVSGEYAKQYYFDYPKEKPLARFILISPGLNFTNGGFYAFDKGSERYRWLSATIHEARSVNIPWVIVGMHLNCMTLLDGRGCETGPDVMNLLIQEKVDLILQGHTHCYMRSGQLSLNEACPGIVPEAFNARCVTNAGSGALYQKGNGAVLVVDGVGGAPLYNLNARDPEAPYFEKTMGNDEQPSHGFLTFTLEPGKLEGRFIRSSGGDFSDSFEIRSIT